jgi:hypothetical protein
MEAKLVETSDRQCKICMGEQPLERDRHGWNYPKYPIQNKGLKGVGKE